jgi:hypothetical protein
MGRCMRNSSSFFSDLENIIFPFFHYLMDLYKDMQIKVKKREGTHAPFHPKPLCMLVKEKTKGS